MVDMSADSSSLVTASNLADGVRVLAFNRPTKRNALSHELIRELLGNLSSADADAGVRVIIITGSNGAFSAGADIKEIAELDAQRARQCRYLENLCEGMRAVRKPLIAAVEGMALGGGFEVALMCDLIIAAEKSRFGLPEVRIGFLPGAGGTQRLTNALGKYKAMRMVLLGASITAAEAAADGLVAEVCEDGKALERALHTASELGSLSPMALSLAKEAICRADDLGQDEAFERSLYYYSFGTNDKVEGVRSFLEKRNRS